MAGSGAKRTLPSVWLPDFRLHPPDRTPFRPPSSSRLLLAVVLTARTEKILAAPPGRVRGFRVLDGGEGGAVARRRGENTEGGGMARGKRKTQEEGNVGSCLPTWQGLN